MKKEVLILTKSARYGANCIVGIDIQNNKFIRLVSSIRSCQNSIPNNLLLCSDGTMANPLDIIEIRFLKPQALEIHAENWLIDENKLWKKIGKINIQQLSKYPLELEDKIFGDTNEYINYEIAKTIGKSIIMVKVSDLFINKNDFNKAKAKFLYKNEIYENFAVTDRNYFDKSLHVENAILIITIPDISDKWVKENNKFYKYIAQVFPITSQFREEQVQIF